MSRYKFRGCKKYNTVIKDCPVRINKSRILYDLDTNLVILQIGLTNLSSKQIKRIKFNIRTFNIDNKIINKNVLVVVDEKVKENSEYSLRKPILFDNEDIYFADIKIKEIVFIDNSVYDDLKNVLEVEVNKPNYIYKASDLYKTLIFNNIDCDIKCYPEFNDGYWRCSCTNINLYDNSQCLLCGSSKKELEEFFDFDNIKELVNEYNDYCVDKIKKRNEKICKIALISLKFLVIILVLVLMRFSLDVFNYHKAYYYYKNDNYLKAIEVLKDRDDNESNILLKKVYYYYGKELLDIGKYQDAIYYFEKSDYYHSDELIKDAKYRLGFNYYITSEYGLALDIFSDLSLYGYKDTDEMINKLNYKIALGYIDNYDYGNAIKYLKNIMEYEDSFEYIKKIMYTYLIYYAEDTWNSQGIVKTDDEWDDFKTQLRDVLEDDFVESFDSIDDFYEMLDYIINLDCVPEDTKLMEYVN